MDGPVEAPKGGISVGSGAHRPRRRHHGLRRWLFAAVGIVAALVAVTVVRSWQGRARPVSVGDATRQFHSTDPAGGGPHPKPGVYSYVGSGDERLTVPPLSQSQGPTMPGTVELRSDGCWTFRLDYSTNHWESSTYCARGAGVEEAGGQVWHKWMVGPIAVTDLTTSTCDPGSMVLPAPRTDGQSWPARCTSTSSAAPGTGVSAGTYRYLGRATLTVGSTKVVTDHFVRTRTLTGAQQGTEHTELWLVPSTGLLVQDRRTFDVHTDTILGSSTYTESGSIRLRFLTPAT